MASAHTLESILSESEKVALWLLHSLSDPLSRSCRSRLPPVVQLFPVRDAQALLSAFRDVMADGTIAERVTTLLRSVHPVYVDAEIRSLLTVIAASQDGDTEHVVGYANNLLADSNAPRAPVIRMIEHIAACLAVSGYWLPRFPLAAHERNERRVSGSRSMASVVPAVSRPQDRVSPRRENTGHRPAPVIAGSVLRIISRWGLADPSTLQILWPRARAFCLGS